MGQPVAGLTPFDQAPPGLGPFQHRAVLADLGKTALARLADFRPTHLVFDLIDERYDLLAVGGAIANATWELQTSGYLDQPAFAGARRISRFSAEYEALWREACLRLAAFVATSPLAEARIILHAAAWAELERRPEGGLRPLPACETPGEIAAQNRLLARYEDLFAQAFPGLAQVAAPELRIADEDHVWGLSPFHYVPEYYREIARQLADLGVVVDAT